MVFIDDKSDAFLYNPADDSTIDIPLYPPSALGVLWDMWPPDKVLYVCSRLGMTSLID